MTSVVVPAHQEEATIAQGLRTLLATARPGEFEVVVVANGCRDATAARARAAARALPGPVTVLDIPEASKVAALNVGDGAATSWPRVYVDADVLLDTDGLRALVSALDDDAVELAAPRRRLRTDGAPWPVRSYLRLWSRLPAVASSLAGVGVYALSRAGRARFGAFPDVVADDLFVHAVVPPAHRRRVPEARVEVFAPRATSALVRRKARVFTGNAQVGALPGLHLPERGGGWRAVVAHDPRRLLDLPAFGAVSVAARVLARRAARAGRVDWHHDLSARVIA